MGLEIVKRLLSLGAKAAMEAFGAIYICVNCAGIATGSKTLGKDGSFQNVLVAPQRLPIW